MDILLLYFDLDGLKYLAGLALIALLLGIGAAVHRYWVERGRGEWDEFLDGLINHD